MTSAVRQIFGPFRSTEDDADANAGVLHWYFFAVRTDGRMSHFDLSYMGREGRFHVKSEAAGAPFRMANRRWTGAVDAPPPELRDSMLPRSISEMPVVKGSLREALKALLSPEDIAAVARVRIQFSRR